jgi:hypothetical protein
MSLTAIIISTVSLCLGLFDLLLNLGIIKVKTKSNDPYAKYRNEDGLLSRKGVTKEQ